MLKIPIYSIHEDPRTFSAEIPADELAVDAELSLDGPVRFSCEIYRTGRKVFIRGRLSATLVMMCARCLEAFSRPLEAPLELVALPTDSPEEKEARKPDEGLDDEDVALMVYQDEQLDLLPEIRDVLLLAVPMKPLCREDCPGLCPQCGKPLAQETCRCAASGLKRPFEILGDLKPRNNDQEAPSTN